MKTHKISSLSQALLILFIAVNPACRTKELRAVKSKSEERVQERSSYDSQHSTALKSERMIHFTDSSKQAFHVMIIPLDTITFSVKDGFRGRASSVEYTGLIGHREVLKENMTINTQSQSEILLKREYESSKAAILKSKNLKKKSISVITGLIILGLLLIYIGLGRKYARWS